ncbi:MAG: carboxynorspermidine decarboxylase [Prevotellaceae bacterium]|nr:carboxynorspermidine decarboxylase [Prevotellaceae bacterium]
MPLRTPCYIVEEKQLRRNLSLIREVARESGAEIIVSFKAFALWRVFPILREYGFGASASSPYEARLALEELGSPAHTYSPAYTEDTFPSVLKCSQSVTFNSLSQYERFYPLLRQSKRPVSCGLRINPEYSEIETELYNPCAPGSRFGILADQLPDKLPEGVEGLHCHCHCESSAEALQRTLAHIEAKFSRYFRDIKWLNLGGGHLMTRKDYNVGLLIYIIKGIRSRYPWLHVVLEPGSAFAWQTGTLVASVVDIVENKGIRTAILDVSFTCHMPDCLEMPYQPAVRGAETLSPSYCSEHPLEPCVYRLGGNSCLSGDFLGCWRFPKPLSIGDHVIFEDMIHYTTVKTTMFNGIHHPSLAILRLDGTLDTLRQFTYEDYRSRMC